MPSLQSLHISRMPTPLRRSGVLLSTLVASVLTTGCFGGGGDDGPPTDAMPTASVPDSALASVAAYTAFTQATAQSSSESAEPLTADNVTAPPVSETDEPVSVP